MEYFSEYILKFISRYITSDCLNRSEDSIRKKAEQNEKKKKIKLFSQLYIYS